MLKRGHPTLCVNILNCYICTRAKIIMLLQAVNNLFNACSDQDVAMLWGQHSTTQVINLFPVVRTMLFPVVRTMLFPVVETTMLFLVVGTMLFPVDESTSMNNAVRTTKINMITVMFFVVNNLEQYCRNNWFLTIFPGGGGDIFQPRCPTNDRQ